MVRRLNKFYCTGIAISETYNQTNYLLYTVEDNTVNDLLLGYFKEPKTTVEISEYLMKQKGYVNKTKDVSANLKNMLDRGQIKRIKEGTTFKYYLNV